MWLKRIISYLRYRKIKQSATHIPINKPSRALCEELLNQLDVELFANTYRPNRGMSVAISVPYKSIEAYVSALKEFNYLIKNEYPISPDWNANDVEYHTTLDRFLSSSKDGYYLDLERILGKFKHEALLLCQLMKESDTATYGLHEHNLRMLTKLFINMRSLLTQLVDVSLTLSRA